MPSPSQWEITAAAPCWQAELSADGATWPQQLANDTVQCWGGNTSGQLGDGTNTERHRPAPVSGIAGSISAMTISAGYGHTCAVRANGTVSCWGDNGSGQLGDGTTTDQHVPTLISGLTNVTATAAGEFHKCALIADGTVSCWGGNNAGQLGDGSVLGHKTPMTVPGLFGVTAIATGNFHTCALKYDGTVYCWGENSDGQLGIGTHSDAFSSVLNSLIEPCGSTEGHPQPDRALRP